MKAGWRVRQAQARRRERLLQDFAGFPVQAGPASGPSSEGQKTQQIRASVQNVQAVRAPEPVWMKTRIAARDSHETPGQDRTASAVPAHGPQNSVDSLDSLDRASGGAALGRSRLPASGGQPGQAPWTDLDAWCARLGAAGGIHARRNVLREWVARAGGWHDGAAVHVPTALPKGLAAATLRAHARALRLDVRDDPDDPAHLRWLRGERP